MNSRLAAAIGALLSLACVHAMASSGCKAWAQSYDEAERHIAMLRDGEYGETSAIRAGARNAAINEQRSIQTTAVNAMIAAHCKVPPPNKLAQISYQVQAMNCGTARLTNADDAEEKCDESKWTPDLSKAKR